jgi:hypothetical protein
MPREHGESGEFVETTTLDDVLNVLDAVEGPVVLSADVADHLGVSRETARRKLNALHDREELARRKVARRVVYWRPEEPDAEAEASAPGRDTTEGTVDTGPHTAGDSRALTDDESEPDAIGEALDGWEPDTEAAPRRARTQTRRAAEWLRDVGEYRRKEEFQDALADDATLSKRVWWDRHVRPGLKHLDDADLVEYMRNRGYRWAGN